MNCYKIEYYFLDFHFLSNRQREDLENEWEKDKRSLTCPTSM